MVSPENVHTDTIIQTEQVIRKNVNLYAIEYIYIKSLHSLNIYVHAIIINEKEAMNFKQHMESYMEGFGEVREERNVIIILSAQKVK